MLVACWLELQYCHFCSYRLRDVHMGYGVCALVINITGAKSIMTYFLIIQKHQMMITVFPRRSNVLVRIYMYMYVCIDVKYQPDLLYSL